MDVYGVDATRLNILTNNDPRLDIKWTNDAMPESLGFFEKVYFYVKSLLLSRVDGLPSTPKISNEETKIREKFLSTLRDNSILHVSRHYEDCQFLHVRLYLQKMLNDIVSAGQIMLLNDEYERCLRTLLLMLYPISPTFCYEMWERLNLLEPLPEINKLSSICEQSWPCISPNYPINIECQINCIKIFNFEVPFSTFSSLNENSAVSLARQHPDIKSSINNLSVLETHFQNSAVNPSINFFTIPRRDILREIDVEINKTKICTIKVSQDDYKLITEKKVIDILKTNSIYKKAMDGQSIRNCKFNFVPSGKSKIKFVIKPKVYKKM